MPTGWSATRTLLTARAGTRHWHTTGCGWARGPGVRASAEHASALAEELGTGPGGGVSSGGVEEGITGDVVVLATPYDAAIAFAERRGQDLAEKVVVDITNPV